MPAEAPAELQLVLDGRDRLVDVPFDRGDDETVRGVERRSLLPVTSRWLVKSSSKLLPAGARGAHPRVRRILEAGHEVGRRHEGPRHQGVVLLVVLHHLGGVLEVPVVLKVHAHIDREPGRLGPEAVVERQHQLAGRDRVPDVHAFAAQERAVVGEAADVVGILGVGERQRQDELVAVVDVLDRRPDVAIPEVPGHVGLELAAPYAGKPGVAHTVIVAVEAARVEVPVLAQRAAGIEVIAGERLRGRGGPHGAGEVIAPGLVDVVDDGARRVGAEQRRGAAPHHLHPLDVFIEPEQVVGVHEVGVHRGKHRHPVFHEHHVLDSRGCPGSRSSGSPRRPSSPPG